MFILVSGCSGAGKSALVAALESFGYPVVPEPGRRIVQEELATSGTALPWIDEAAFARKVMQLALEDLQKAAALQGPVFFDRSVVDAATALEQLTGTPTANVPCVGAYHTLVFLAPPWPDLSETDRERRHGYDAAVAEYGRLCAAYPALGYKVHLLPFSSVADRADFVLRTVIGARS